MRTCADSSLRLSGQALAVLAILTSRAPDFADYLQDIQDYDIEIHTYTWYCGRQRGIALVVFAGYESTGPVLILTVAEHRSCDEIVVEEWVEPSAPHNGPTLLGREAVLGERIGMAAITETMFPNGQVGAAADHMVTRMSQWYRRQRGQA